MRPARIAVRALCVETHETWLEDNRYLAVELLKEQRRERLRVARLMESFLMPERNLHNLTDTTAVSRAAVPVGRTASSGRQAVGPRLAAALALTVWMLC